MPPKKTGTTPRTTTSALDLPPLPARVKINKPAASVQQPGGSLQPTMPGGIGQPVVPAHELYGWDQGDGYGVWGESTGGDGLHGEASTGFGVYGRVNGNSGVGVQGVSATGGYGVAGTIESGFGIGVFGYSHDGTAVRGDTANGWAGRFNGRVAISSDVNVGGQLGIGTTQPGAALDVRGSASISGDASITGNASVAGNINVTGDVYLVGADCAEEFEIGGGETVEAGTVMVIADDGSLLPSELPYDRRVAGVVSGAGELRPGITLGRQASGAGRVPVGLAGRVYCRVDASYGKIEVGDLLTTSPTRGHAMKAVDAAQAFGCVLGKALRRVDAGASMIPVLIALQ